eukprot:477680-Alexandrium_andersonii.AAC.1
MSIIVKETQLEASWCRGRATEADSPRGRGQTPSTEDKKGPLRPASKWAANCGREHSKRAM